MEGFGRKTLLMGPLALLAVACWGPSGPEPIKARLETDRESYTATLIGTGVVPPQYGFTVVASFQNRGEAPVYLARCTADDPSPMFFVRVGYDVAEEGSAYSAGWMCTGHDQLIEVRPGETRSHQLFLSGPNAPGGDPQGKLTGRFRLAYVAQSCRTAACRRATIVESNDFTVTLGGAPAVAALSGPSDRVSPQ